MDNHKAEHRAWATHRSALGPVLAAALLAGVLGGCAANPVAQQCCDAPVPYELQVAVHAYRLEQEARSMASPLLPTGFSVNCPMCGAPNTDPRSRVLLVKGTQLHLTSLERGIAKVVTDAPVSGRTKFFLPGRALAHAVRAEEGGE